MAKAELDFVKASIAANQMMTSDELAKCFEGWSEADIQALKDEKPVDPVQAKLAELEAQVAALSAGAK